MILVTTQIRWITAPATRVQQILELLEDAEQPPSPTALVWIFPFISVPNVVYLWFFLWFITGMTFSWSYSLLLQFLNLRRDTPHISTTLPDFNQSAMQKHRKKSQNHIFVLMPDIYCCLHCSCTTSFSNLSPWIWVCRFWGRKLQRMLSGLLQEYHWQLWLCEMSWSNICTRPRGNKYLQLQPRYFFLTFISILLKIKTIFINFINYRPRT